MQAINQKETGVQRHSRRSCLRSIGALGLAGIGISARAEADWPVRPIRLVVGSAPGGGTDLFARLAAKRLSAELGQPVVVENKAGANGMLATETVVRAPADGYTLLFSYSAAMLVNPIMRSKGAIDPLKGLRPIAQLGTAGNLLIVSPELPVSDVKELVAYIKSNPDRLSYGSWGIGSGGHLIMQQLLGIVGQTMTHVPYQGSGPVAAALMGGSLSIGWVDVSSQVQQIKAGKLRAIGVSGTRRLPQLPEVPTLQEQGSPLTTMAWYGLFAPEKTTAPIIQKLNGAVRNILNDPEFKAQLASFNLPDSPYTTPEQFRQIIVDDTRLWTGLVRDAGLTVE